MKILSKTIFIKLPIGLIQILMLIKLVQKSVHVHVCVVALVYSGMVMNKLIIRIFTFINTCCCTLSPFIT